MVNYKQKYLKYKLKYQQLLKQKAGMIPTHKSSVTVKYLLDGNLVTMNFKIDKTNIKESFLENINKINKNQKNFRIITQGKLMYYSIEDDFDLTLYNDDNIFHIVFEDTELQTCVLMNTGIDTSIDTGIDTKINNLENNKIYFKYNYPMVSNLDTQIVEDQNFLREFFYITNEIFKSSNMEKSQSESLTNLVIIITVNSITDINFSFKLYMRNRNPNMFNENQKTFIYNLKNILKYDDRKIKDFIQKLYNYNINLLIDNMIINTLIKIVIDEYNLDNTNNF